MFCWQKIRVYNSYKHGLVFTKTANDRGPWTLFEETRVWLVRRLAHQYTCTTDTRSFQLPIVPRSKKSFVVLMKCSPHMNVWIKNTKIPLLSKSEILKHAVKWILLETYAVCGYVRMPEAAMHVNIDLDACVLTFRERMWVGLRTLLGCCNIFFSFSVLCGEIVFLVPVCSLLFVVCFENYRIGRRLQVKNVYFQWNLNNL